jgi:hypothetical protein
VLWSDQHPRRIEIALLHMHQSFQPKVAAPARLSAVVVYGAEVCVRVYEVMSRSPGRQLLVFSHLIRNVGFFFACKKVPNHIEETALLDYGHRDLMR